MWEYSFSLEHPQERRVEGIEVRDFYFLLPLSEQERHRVEANCKRDKSVLLNLL